jgi:hexosaminidase
MTKLILLALLLANAPLAMAQQSQMNAKPETRNLMPMPASVQFRSGKLALAKSFTVAASGVSDARLQGGVDRALRRLERRTGLEFARGLASDAATATLVVKCDGPGKTVPAIGEDESYSLEVSDRQAVLSAPTVVGALRGLETFLQLVESDRDGYYVPLATVKDKPRFQWRGLMIDSGRHFQPVEVIKRNLDGMAAVKLNVFHWHLTEDQGFRVETKKYPKLHTMGSDGQFYTQEQIRDIIAYARDRGIRVVPEFDIPGHATSWLVGHPELASAPGPYQIERHFGIFDPTLDPTKEETYKLLDGFLGEMAGLFPDEYMHIGGDENNGKQWDANPQIQGFMKAKGIKDNHALQSHFNQRVLPILTKYGKRMMGWDEIFQPDIPKNVVIHSWRGQEALAAAARLGYDGVLSNGYYIDLMYPASQHYVVDPIPADSTLTPEQMKHILGGEATMWSEWVSPDTIDSRIWPRTAAIAERLWSPGSVKDVDDMYRRLSVVRMYLEEVGLTHDKNLAVLLRSLARTDRIDSLKTLVSVVEPVKEYRRGQMRPGTSLGPLTGLIDAARADAEATRPVATMVDGLLSDAPRFGVHQGHLQETFSQWRDVRPTLDVIIDGAPALREAEPLVQDLADLGVIGLEALSYLSANVAPPQAWVAAKTAVLDRAAKPKAAVEFTVIPSVRQLVTAAAELPRLKTMSAGEWHMRVKTLAAEKPVVGSR